MKNIIATFVLTFCFAATAFATPPKHVPGYMGKKLSVGANVSTFFMFEDFSDVTDMIFSTRFSYKTELAATYTVGRRVSLGASYYFAKQKYTSIPSDYQNGYNYTTVIPKEDFVACKLRIVEFNMKIFRRNFLAPIGPYHQVGIGVVKYNASAPGDSIILLNANSPSRVAGVARIPSDPYSCVKLSYHIGYAAPVFKNCYFNFAFGVNFFRGGDSPKIKTSITSSNYALAMMNKHLRRHNFLEFKIGFSWLAL